MRDNHVKHNVPVDYSKNSTVEEIYVYVAKDFIKEGDFASLFRFAGIGQARSEDMKHLPSWVPDWSGSLERYSLPRRSTSFVSPRETNSNNSNGSLWISHEGGSEFLFVTGILVGRLEHLSRLTTQFSDKDSDIEDTEIIDARMQQFWNPNGSEVSYGDISIFFEEVKADILAQQSRFNSALQSVLSHQVVQRRYNMTNAEQAKKALVRTCMANTAPNGSTAATDDIRWYEERWVGMSCQGPVGAALWLPDNQMAVELDSASKLQIRKGICKGYMLQRQGQVGSNSISAQFVRSEILPSFASYGYRSGLEMRGIWPPDLEESFAQTEESKRLQKAENMFTDVEGGPLAVFTASVDYTFGRMLAITDSGFLGLVPDKAEKGDLLIWLEHDHMFLLLRPSESELRAQKAGDSSERQCRGDEGKSLEDEMQSVRFVGESYVHEFVLMKKSTESFEQKRFKLW